MDRSQRASLDLRGSVDADVDELVALFRRCYEPRPSVFQPTDRQAWWWKYPGNPRGYSSLVACDQGRIVAHVGGVPFGLWHRGRERSSLQSADHMVDPLWRRGLRSGAVFGWLMGTWMELSGSPTTHVLAWGFPSREDFRLGHGRLAYGDLGPVEVLVHDSIRSLLAYAPPFEAQPYLGEDRELDELWRRCRVHLPMSVDRGPMHMRWRYGFDPFGRYVFRSVRDEQGRLRGACVLRGGGLSDDTALLLEWLVPCDDPEAEAALLAVAAHEAMRLRCGSLGVWLEPWQPGFTRLRRMGFGLYGSVLRHVAHSWDPALTVEEVRATCSWSLGAVDFL